MAQSHNVSTIILQWFNMITKELKKFTNKVSGNFTKITTTYSTAQEYVCKFIENAILQVLTEAQNVTTLPTSVDSRNFGVKYTNS